MLRAFCCTLLLTLFAVPGAALAVGDSRDSQFPRDLPKGAKLVSGPTKSGARLYAADDRHGLCISLLESDGAGTDCGEAPSPFLRLLSASVYSTDHATFVYGSVRPVVAAVEVVFKSGRRAKAETALGGYTGRYAKRVRFYVVELPGTHFNDDVRYTRLLDSAGNLIAVAGRDFIGKRVSPLTVLRKGRIGRHSWRLRAFRREVRAPVPRDEERFETNTCVDMGGSLYAGGTEVCRMADLPEPDLAFQARSGCSGLRGVGLVSARVRSVDALLGSGRLRRLRTAALPAALGGGRAVGLAGGPRTAVRRVIARDAAGRVLQTKQLRVEPGSVGCPHDGAFIISYGLDELKPAGVATPHLQVRDLGARLCATVTVFSPLGRDCGLPPLEAYEARYFTERAGGSTLVSGVLPGFVARVEVEFADGGKESIPAAFDGPYSGRFQGTVRFFSKQFRGNRYALAVRLFDSSGHRAFTSPGPDSFRQIGRPRTLLRGPGGLRVGVGTAQVDGGRSFLCVLTGHRRLPRDGDSCGFGIDGVLEIAAPCSPRQIEITGGISARVRSVTFFTTRGEVPAKIRRFHGKGFGGAVLLAAIPSRAAVRSFVVRTTRGVRRNTLSVPSAASQCGWSTYTDL